MANNAKRDQNVTLNTAGVPNEKIAKHLKVVISKQFTMLGNSFKSQATDSS